MFSAAGGCRRVLAAVLSAHACAALHCGNAFRRNKNITHPVGAAAARQDGHHRRRIDNAGAYLVAEQQPRHDRQAARRHEPLLHDQLVELQVLMPRSRHHEDQLLRLWTPFESHMRRCRLARRPEPPLQHIFFQHLLPTSGPGLARLAARGRSPQ